MRDLIVILCVVALVPMALARPWIGLLGYTLIGFWNPHKFTWTLQNFRIALIVGGATLVGLLLTRDRKSIPWTRELVLMLLLAVYFVFTTLFAWSPDAAYEQLDRVLRIYFMTFIMGVLIFGERKIRGLLWALILGIGFFGVKGGIFALQTGGQLYVLGPESTFLEANTALGLAFNMILPLLLCLAQEQKTKWRQLAVYGAAFLTMIATVFTYSRGAWLGLTAILALSVIRMKRGLYVDVLLAIVGVVGVGFVPDKVFNRAETIGNYEEDNSAMTRVQAWSVAWHLALQKPLTGGGFDYETGVDPERWLSYADRKYDVQGSTPRAAHSIYFQVLGQHGFVALGLFLALLGGTMLSYSDIYRKTRGRPEMEWMGDYARALQTGMIGFLVSGSFLNLAYFDLVYLYIGLIPIMKRELREQPLPALEPSAGWRTVRPVTNPESLERDSVSG